MKKEEKSCPHSKVVRRFIEVEMSPKYANYYLSNFLNDLTSIAAIKQKNRTLISTL